MPITSLRFLPPTPVLEVLESRATWLLLPPPRRAWAEQALAPTWTRSTLRATRHPPPIVLKPLPTTWTLFPAEMRRKCPPLSPCAQFWPLLGVKKHHSPILLLLIKSTVPNHQARLLRASDRTWITSPLDLPLLEVLAFRATFPPSVATPPSPDRLALLSRTSMPCLLALPPPLLPLRCRTT